MNVASNADHHIPLHCVCQRRVVCVKTSGCVRTGEILEGKPLIAANCALYLCVCVVGRQADGRWSGGGEAANQREMNWWACSKTRQAYYV